MLNPELYTVHQLVCLWNAYVALMALIIPGDLDTCTDSLHKFQELLNVVGMRVHATLQDAECNRQTRVDGSMVKLWLQEDPALMALAGTLNVPIA